MIKIFKLLNGTNDVAALKTQSEEALKAKNWTIGYLNLLQTRKFKALLSNIS
jgi:hypothetical protein